MVIKIYKQPSALEVLGADAELRDYTKTDQEETDVPNPQLDLAILNKSMYHLSIGNTGC